MADEATIGTAPGDSEPRVPARAGGGRVLWPVVALMALALATAACVAHPVGPARTFGKYEEKATTTAESALSSVETARLAAEAASKGNSFGPYTASVLSDAEEAAAGVQATFASIQPPDERADQLRDELDDLLSAAQSHLADVRIAARRGELAGLDGAAAPLADDAARLRAFVEAHR